jgi:DnaJ-class molecular chaperone
MIYISHSPGGISGATAEDVFSEMFRQAGFGGMGGFGSFGGFGGFDFNQGPPPMIYQLNLQLEDFFVGKDVNLEVQGA